ncbi:beta-propeller fold lactonase family protein [bacterium]|nr:beta-propeller fold lactonase family protein [bacterium]
MIGDRPPRRRAARCLCLGWAAIGVVLAAPAGAQFLYVNNNATVNSVSGYAVNLGSGALTPLAGSPFATGGVGGFNADIDSIAVCRNLLFASNGGGNTVSVFTLAGGTGVLTPAAGSPYPTGACPTGLACTPDAQHLYVADFCANTITIFDVNPATGAMTVNAAGPYVLPIGSLSPFDLEIDAAGSRLFVSQDNSANIGVFDIDGSGALTPVAGSPFAAVAMEHGAVLSPNGAFYYVANLGASISGYAVGGGGALTPMAGSPFATAASDLAMTAGGEFLIGANYATNRLGVYAVNPVSGVPAPVAGSPFTTDAVSPGGVASAFGYVFVANGFFNVAANSVSVYRINGVSGALTSVTGSPFARGVTSAATGIVFASGAVCGDGMVELGEQCDDGNAVGGDCCSATCSFEANGSSCADATLCDGDETCDGAGACLPGTPLDCDDGDGCTADSCDDALGCVYDDAPRGGCVAAPQSLLLLKQNGGGKDKLLWKWIKGGAITPAQLADPTASADYALCLYTGGALMASAALPAGARWTGGGKGYKYSDPAGSPGGILKALVKSGSGGKAKVVLKGKGNNLPDPPLGSLAFPVDAQLVNTASGFCVAASFSAGNVVTSSGSTFKAKTP